MILLKTKFIHSSFYLRKKKGKGNKKNRREERMRWFLKLGYRRRKNKCKKKSEFVVQRS